MGSKQAGDAAYGFIAEAMTWTGVVLMTGWLEKFPRLKVAILESNSSWLPLVLEKAETYLDLYKHMGEKIGDPHDVFYKHCFIAFESDEIVTLRLWDLYENIALWSSDMPHLDASDVWEAIDKMNKWKVPQDVQEKMLGGNARRLVWHRAAARWSRRRRTSIGRRRCRGMQEAERFKSFKQFKSFKPSKTLRILAQ